MAADIYDHVVNWMFADPVLVGKYPADEFAQLLSGPVDEDLKIIGAPLDWYGINYYEPTMIAAPVEGQGTEGVLEVDLPPGPALCPCRDYRLSHNRFRLADRSRGAGRDLADVPRPLR